MPGTILAIDAARTTGWCAGVPGQRPHYGAVTLRGITHGATYAAFVDWLEDAIRLHDPAEIVVEAPLHSGGHLGQDAATLALGFLAHLELVCHDRSIRLLTEHVQTTRKQVIGRGHFPKGTAKAEVIAWCRAQGFDPPDDNSADALVLWKHVEQIKLRRAA